MSVTSSQVISLLENVLFESSTQAAANEAGWAATPAATNIANLATAMAASPEESIAAHIVGYYLTALGRAPTAAEIRFYVAYAEQGLTSAQIAAGQVPASTWTSVSSYFTNSPEFASRSQLDYSLGTTGALLEAVPWLYESVLGRAPSTAEISFYDSLVTSGTSLASLFGYFTGSQEFHTDTASQIATALTSNGTAAASGQPAPTTIGATVTLGPPPPPPPPAAPQPVVFTTGTDTLSTNDSSIIYSAILGGASPTLTANDSLHGAGNTLNITDTSGATSQDIIPSGVSLTGVATITLITSGNAGQDSTHLFDLSGVTGLTSVTLTSSGTQGDFINIGSATSLSVTTHGAGDTLTFTGNSLSTLTLSSNVTMGTSGTHFSLPASLTSLAASSDNAALYLTLQGSGATVTLGGGNDQLTDNQGGNTLSLGNGTNVIVNSGTAADTITVGTGTNTIDVGSLAATVLHLGPDANFNTAPTTPDVTVENATAGIVIKFTSILNIAFYASDSFVATSPADVIQLLETAVEGNPRAAESESYGGNLYIVATDTGILSPTDTTVIELVGTHTLHLVGAQITVLS